MPATPWDNLKAQVVLGSDKFWKKICATASGNAREQPAARRLAARPDWAAVVATVERLKGEPWEDFRDRYGDGGRDLALHLGRQACQLKLSALGKLAGDIDYMSVATALHRFQQRLRRDKKLAAHAAKAMSTLYAS